MYSKNAVFLLFILSTLWHEYVVMMTKGGSTKIVNFMTPGAGLLVVGHGHISHTVKMHYFFKNLLLYTLRLNWLDKLNVY